MRLWLLLTGLFPLLLWQARRVRAATPRLPEARGEHFGLIGPAGCASLRLLVIGESTAAGVGVEHHDQGLAAQVSRQLLRRYGRPVRWQTLGVSGIDAAGLAQHLRNHPIRQLTDLIVLSLGVNDVTSLTPVRRYRRALARLIKELRRQQPGVPICLVGVPPMQDFTALPWPLRQALGLRATGLDREHHRLARRAVNVHYHHCVIDTDPDYLAADGYHPSEKGYACIGKQVANAIADRFSRLC